MRIEDRRRWDARHAEPELEPAGEPVAWTYRPWRSATRALLARSGYAAGVRFEVFDPDPGLPPGPPCALLLCHNFRDA